ncbi:MAG: hypothetical protein ACKVZH_26920 [Blastocatellia bacterium]
MFTSINDSNSLVAGFYLILWVAMTLVASVSVLFALGSVICAVLDCHRIKPPNHTEASANHAAMFNLTR